MCKAEICDAYTSIHLTFCLAYIMQWFLVIAHPAHDTATNKEWQLPEAVLIQFISPDDEHDMLETCREL